MRARVLRRSAAPSSTASVPAVPRRRDRRVCTLLAVAALAPFGLAACGSDGGGGAGGQEIRSLKILVGTAPGGGFDLTARAVAQAGENAGLVRTAQVSNVEGAGSTIALSKLANANGDADQLQLMGLGLVGGIVSNNSSKTLADTTPIARLTEESDIVVVPADSKYKTLEDFVAAWKANPRIPVGSGSSPGGPDHLATVYTAKAAGIEPKQVNHVSFDGGGELLTATLGGQVDAAFTGVGEVTEQLEAGKLRALAVTAPERVPGVDAPTLKEAGLDAEMLNWRGIVAPPGLSAEDRTALVAFARKLNASPEWKAELEKNGWTDAFQAGDEFETFVDTETQRVTATLDELGLGS
jgi:putative tricarboxylic transport membrane protein